MAEGKLRELERRWKESGSPDDEAPYLLERVRAGELTRDALELAAHLGHPAARLAGGSRAQGWELEALGAWAEGLERWGKPVCVRAGLTLVRLFDHDEDDCERAASARWRQIAIQAWLRDPSEKKRKLMAVTVPRQAEPDCSCGGCDVRWTELVRQCMVLGEKKKRSGKRLRELVLMAEPIWGEDRIRQVVRDALLRAAKIVTG